MRAGIAIDLAARRLTRERNGGQLINAVLGALADRHGVPTKLRRECGLDAMTLAFSEGPERGARQSQSCTTMHFSAMRQRPHLPPCVRNHARARCAPTWPSATSLPRSPLSCRCPASSMYAASESLSHVDAIRRSKHRQADWSRPYMPRLVRPCRCAVTDEPSPRDEHVGTLKCEQRREELASP